MGMAIGGFEELWKWEQAVCMAGFLQLRLSNEE
jgi:hypothetical protein